MVAAAVAVSAVVAVDMVAAVAVAGVAVAAAIVAIAAAAVVATAVIAAIAGKALRYSAWRRQFFQPAPLFTLLNLPLALALSPTPRGAFLRLRP